MTCIRVLEKRTINKKENPCMITFIIVATTHLCAIFADHQGPDIVCVTFQLHETGHTVPGVIHLQGVLCGPRHQNCP